MATPYSTARTTRGTRRTDQLPAGPVDLVARVDRTIVVEGSMKLADQLALFHAAMIGATPIAEATPLLREDGVDRETRLRVYLHAYLSRIGGVLEEHYPKLRALLGDATFRPLVRDYLRAHPPRDPSLREAGAHVSRFLFHREPKTYLHIDLARLERARIEAFDGPDADVLTRDAVAALPPEEFPSLRLALVPTATLLLISTNADDVWDAIEDESAIPAAIEGPRTVLVWRRGVTVIHRTLEPDEASALQQLSARATFAGVCEVFATQPDPTARAIELLLRWLDAEILRA